MVLEGTAGLLLLPVAMGAQARRATLYLTTADRASLMAPQELKGGKVDSAAAVLTINAEQSMQTVDGFGFAMTGGSAQLLMKMEPAARAALLQRLFGSGKDDIATSYVRLTIGASDMNERVFTYDDMPAGAEDEALAHFDPGPDKQDVIPVMKQVLAINPKLKILASPWTAPSWMKTNGDVKGGSLKPEFYTAYAEYLVKYLQAMEDAGISIDAMTVQNEPENDKNTPSLVMTAHQQANFIATALGPALEKAGLATKIILFDHNCDHPDYPIEVLSDEEAAKYVDGSAFHLYFGKVGAMTEVHDAFPHKNIYFTEQMTVENLPGGALKPIEEPVSRIVIGAMRNWSRNVLLWNLAADPQFGPHTGNGGCPVCQGAVTIDGNVATPNIAFYTIAQASKFVPPGSMRVASSDVAGVSSVAFRRPDEKIAVLVANDGSLPRSFVLKQGEKSLPVTLPGHAVGTVVW